MVQYISRSGLYGIQEFTNHRGDISVIALMIRKELLLPLLCGIFLIENIGGLTGRLFQIHQKRKQE